MYDANNPDIGTKKSVNSVRRNNYKQNEKKLRTFFILYFLIVILYGLTLSSMQAVCTNIITTPEVYVKITLVVGLFNFSVKTITFKILMYTMKKYQNFVYSKNFKSWVIFFCLDLMSYAMSVWIYTYSREVEYINQVTLYFYMLNAP